MKDQHEKIKGYRDLSQDEIDLMNKVKAHAEVTAALIIEIKDMRVASLVTKEITTDQYHSSADCLLAAKTSLQTGQMWLVRAVALPDNF